MNFVALGKYTITFSSSLFDVVSDVINSLNFLGYYKDPTEINRSLKNFTNEQENSFNNSNYSNVCNSTFEIFVENNDEVHQIWGILSMLLVFLPGIIGGSFWVAIGFSQAIRKRDCEDFGLTLLVLLISILFPFAFIIGQLVMIFWVGMKKEHSKMVSLFITGVTNLEASIESVGQLCLQFFTVLYGYPSGVIQKITIATSFIQIARCAILNDMEAKLVIDDKQLSFVESLWETIQRLPAYVSTIIFKVFSLVLCMAYLRVYAIIPMVLLFFELIVVTWIRMKNSTDSDTATKVLNGFYLLFSNIGVVNAYTFFNGWMMEDDDLNEKDEDIIKFVRQSSIITFIHHSSVLVFIMVLGWHYPDAFEHWNSPTFWLSPCKQLFYFVFIVVLLIGVYSLTVILYRAKNISTVQDKHTVIAKNEVVELKKNENNDDKEE